MKLISLALLLLFVVSSSGQPATCVPAPPGLVGWWRGEGDATDSAGADNGTLVGGVTFTNGEVGQAFNFDGVTGYVGFGNSTNLNIIGPITIEAWVNRNGAPNNFGAILTKAFFTNSWSPPYVQYSLAFWGTTEKPSFCFAVSETENVCLIANSQVPPDQWTHLAATYDGTNIALYLNGVLDALQPETRSIVSRPETSVTSGSGGQYAFQGEIYAGLIDEISVYSRALSQAEIQGIYLAGSAGKCSTPFIIAQPQGQVGYWGRSVTFTVEASGAPPLGYLWYKDGFPIPWATNPTIVLTNLALDEGGNYSVVVSNALGSVTSSNAFLTVNPAGVTLGLYAGLTIQGAAGNTYGIQYSTNVSPTTTWNALTQITLTQPVQLWLDTNVDVVAGNSPRRFYRVVAIP